MGFDVNFHYKPIIKEAHQTQDGGAGNTGYFEQEEKNKKDNDKSIFDKDGSDAFVKHDNDAIDEDEFSISKWIAQIILSIKDWFKKILG